MPRRHPQRSQNYKRKQITSHSESSRKRNTQQIDDNTTNSTTMTTAASTRLVLQRTLRPSLGRTAFSRTIAQPRLLSTHGQASVCRFQEALEDYRIKNYTQTIPPRFKKEICNVISNPQQNATITATLDDQKRVAVQDIERFLQNIGALGQKVTHEDVETIVSEVWEESLLPTNDELRAESIVQTLL